MVVLRWVAVGVVLVVGPARAMLLAQETAQSASPEAVSFVVSARTLERIQTALASELTLDFGDDSLRFYSDVAVKWPTFAEYVQGSDARFGMERANPYAAPGDRPALGAGMGVDLLGLASSVARGFRAAQQRRRTREINERIDRELDAIERSR